MQKLNFKGQIINKIEQIDRNIKQIVKMMQGSRQKLQDFVVNSSIRKEIHQTNEEIWDLQAFLIKNGQEHVIQHMNNMRTYFFVNTTQDVRDKIVELHFAHFKLIYLEGAKDWESMNITQKWNVVAEVQQAKGMFLTMLVQNISNIPKRREFFQRMDDFIQRIFFHHDIDIMREFEERMIE